MISNFKDILINKNLTIMQSMVKLQKSAKKILFVVDHNKKIIGTLTDGDLRRAIIKDKNLDIKIENVYNKNFLKVNKNLSLEKIKKIMLDNSINHLPVVDDKNKIIGYHYLDEENFNLKKNNYNFDFIIMAGGKGTRLMPFTKNIPKPMLKIGQKSILENIILNAKKYGIYKLYISVNYLSDIIIKYFKDGKKFGVDIKYIKEKIPQGTIGCIGNIKEKILNNIIVCNGDLLTNVNFMNLINFHKKNKAYATMGVFPQKIENQYGVVETKNIKITSIVEKPVTVSYINAGVYVFSKKAINFLKKNKYMDAVSFFEFLKKKHKKIIAFTIT